MKAHILITIKSLCSYQVAGQTESLTCAVHNDVPDHTEDLCVFVHKEVLWVCQAWEITQPTITNTVLTTHTTGRWDENTKIYIIILNKKVIIFYYP